MVRSVTAVALGLLPAVVNSNQHVISPLVSANSRSVFFFMRVLFYINVGL